MRDRDPKSVERAMAILTASPGRERNLASWEVCADVVRSLNEFYLPPDFMFPEGVDAAFLESLRDPRDNAPIRRGDLEGARRHELEELRAKAMTNGRSFGLWRNAVLDHEGECAKKLQTLAWVTQTLYRLRDLETANTDIIDRLATKLGDVLIERWERADVPLTGDIRTWSLRSARRYDLCPRLWRYA